jgi:hypothetical protein
MYWPKWDWYWVDKYMDLHPFFRSMDEEEHINSVACWLGSWLDCYGSWLGWIFGWFIFGGTIEYSMHWPKWDWYWVDKHMELYPSFRSMFATDPINFVARSGSWWGCFASWVCLSFLLDSYLHLYHFECNARTRLLLGWYTYGIDSIVEDCLRGRIY